MNDLVEHSRTLAEAGQVVRRATEHTALERPLTLRERRLLLVDAQLVVQALQGILPHVAPEPACALNSTSPETDAELRAQIEATMRGLRMVESGTRDALPLLRPSPPDTTTPSGTRPHPRRKRLLNPPQPAPDQPLSFPFGEPPSTRP